MLYSIGLPTCWSSFSTFRTLISVIIVLRIWNDIFVLCLFVILMHYWCGVSAFRQTWDLSKNLHRRIFRLKILPSILPNSNSFSKKKHKKWVVKFTPLAKILHCRRQWQIPPLAWEGVRTNSNKLRWTRPKRQKDKSTNRNGLSTRPY